MGASLNIRSFIRKTWLTPAKANSPGKLFSTLNLSLASLPISYLSFYFTELAGLIFGIEEAHLGLANIAASIMYAIENKSV